MTLKKIFSATGKRSATIPSTASDDFYQRLLDGTIDDWENQSELTDEILASIPMEEMDKPDYEPLEVCFKSLLILF